MCLAKGKAGEVLESIKIQTNRSKQRHVMQYTCWGRTNSLPQLSHSFLGLAPSNSVHCSHIPQERHQPLFDRELRQKTLLWQPSRPESIRLFFHRVRCGKATTFFLWAIVALAVLRGFHSYSNQYRTASVKIRSHFLTP